MEEKDLVVIGGGIIGLALAYKWICAKKKDSVVVLEKEKDVGRHQSSHNSGVLHAGLYYSPGSLKAKLAVEGIRQMVSFCKENKIAHEICGKLVVATEEREVAELHRLKKQGEQNGLVGLRILDAQEMRKIEPYVRGVAAIFVPEEGIVDYRQVCLELAAKIESMRGKILKEVKITGIEKKGKLWEVRTDGRSFLTSNLVNCAGLHSDRICRMAMGSCPLRIVPFRGEYFELKQDKTYLVKNLIYPVPDPRFPFLGVHLTRMINGKVEAGPNAVLSLSREGYNKGSFDWKDAFDSLTYVGLWNFLKRYPLAAWEEWKKSSNKRLFCRAVQKLVPAIKEEDLGRGAVGIRAQALFPDGRLVNDFLFVKEEGILHLLNAPSPGATASLAIADELIKTLEL
ncbi:L-2-hydroxyglutarate oxidase [Candidatus Methylacidiphilum infernorum]|uniref:Malate/quinone oxidoreductase or related dehydrogenase n=1 Tax=Methylacidiphilum infernorum (isolate V4) TaxID=481448 RepID=B3DZE4_METI4|nr:L-2-hydroxyglutarate oxidase [Candidatus Methylacidiphilum infernorum]ACD82561.1 Malate/quinone oxidoreductase or related dehydrogenase [Methylacidiphilum infernorum V4]